MINDPWAELLWVRGPGSPPPHLLVNCGYFGIIKHNSNLNTYLSKLPQKENLTFKLILPLISGILHLQYSSGLEKAKKCLLADFLPKSACEAGSFGEQGARSARRLRGPGTSEASALSPPQAKKIGLGVQSAPRSHGAGTSEASALSPPQAKNFGLFTYCIVHVKPSDAIW